MIKVGYRSVNEAVEYGNIPKIPSDFLGSTIKSVAEVDLVKLGSDLEFYKDRYRPVPKKTKVKILDIAISAYMKKLESICGCKLTKSESHQVDTKGVALEWRIAPDPNNKTKAFYEYVDSWYIIIGFDSNTPRCGFFLVVFNKNGERMQSLQYKIPHFNEEPSKNRELQATNESVARDLAIKSIHLAKLVYQGDLAKLTKYLKSLGDGEVITDPEKRNITYTKAVGSVDGKPTGKSGWGYRIDGRRMNVYLMSDEEVAKNLLRSAGLG